MNLPLSCVTSHNTCVVSTLLAVLLLGLSTFLGDLDGLVTPHSQTAQMTQIQSTELHLGHAGYTFSEWL